MSSLTKFFSIISILALSACSFNAVYNQSAGGLSSKLANITSIQVSSEDQKNARYAQQFEAHLEDAINRRAATDGDQYHLSATVSRSRGSQLVQPDSEVTRYELRVSSNWTLTSITSDEEIASGNSRIVGSFDAETSDFATYAAEEDTAKRLMKELANDIRLKLANALAQ